MGLIICQLLSGSYPPQGYLPVSQFKCRRSIPVVAVFLQHIINSVMYRTEEASDPLNNKLVKAGLHGQFYLPAPCLPSTADKNGDAFTRPTCDLNKYTRGELSCVGGEFRVQRHKNYESK